MVDGNASRGREVEKLFNYNGVVRHINVKEERKKKEEAERKAKMMREEEEAKENLVLNAMALKRGMKRQTSFKEHPLGSLLSIKEVDEIAAKKDEYISKAKKHYKGGGDSDDEDGGDDEDDEEESQGGGEEQAKKVEEKKDVEFVRITEDGKVEIVEENLEKLEKIEKKAFEGFAHSGYKPLDRHRFKAINEEFPPSKWLVLRNYDGHYRISHHNRPNDIYGRLNGPQGARAYMLTMSEDERGNASDPAFVRPEGWVGDEKEEEGEGGEGGEAMEAEEVKAEEQADAEPPMFDPTPYDNFGGDEPDAPETLRRCLAIVRTICMMADSQKFIFPVNATEMPTYYEKVLRPICIMDIGNEIKRSCTEYDESPDSVDQEKVVTKFDSNFRLLINNCFLHNTVGSIILNSMEHVACVYERLLFDWILSPKPFPIENVDDEKCYNQGEGWTRSEGREERSDHPKKLEHNN